MVVATAAISHPKISGRGGRPLGQSEIVKIVLQKNPGWTYATIAGLTDDQFLHAGGVDLDELYTGRHNGAISDESMRREWLEIFQKTADSLGMSIPALQFFGKNRAIELAENICGQLNRALFWPMLTEVANEPG